MSMVGERRRDDQQWILDWMVKTTGRPQNFASDERQLPREVKSHRMIPRVMEDLARTSENIAREAERAGHHETARNLYWVACRRYNQAQHAIFRDDDPEKIYLHGKVLECFAKVAERATHPIEVVEIPFEDNYIQGVLHLVPGGRRRPTVLFCPGMDGTKESAGVQSLNPMNNPFVARGFNSLHIDGPGQGTSSIRKIRVTLDSYERAAGAAIDFLVARPEVDPERILVYGQSMGSYWAMRIAAIDPRVKVVASSNAVYGPKRAIFGEASPRFKQVFMYMSGIHDEAEFDRMAEQMVLDDLAPRIRVPTLMIAGEYDPLSHLEDVVAVYEKVAGPKELWIVERDFHNLSSSESFGGIEFFNFMVDWCKDAIEGHLPADLDRKRLIRHGSHEALGPYGPPIADHRLPWRAGRDGAHGHTTAQLGPAGIRPER